MGRLVAILVLLATWGCASAAAVDVRTGRLVDGGDQTRLELELSGPCTHSVFPMHKPERLVIDIPDATLRGRLPLAPGDHPTLAGLRSGVRAGDDLRMVLDVKQAVRTKTFLRKPDAEGGHRLVIDLTPTAPSAPPPAKTTAPKDAQKAKAPESQGAETQVKAAEPKALETKSARTKGGKTKGRTLVIAIDPGHGGKDPGAIGPKGTREKDITLAVAKRLAALVAKEPGMRPYLIRDGDSFVPLRKRMSKARAQGADLFISIHADAFKDAEVRGSAVFTLSPRGASSEAAKWLADRENAVDLVGGVDLGEADNVLATVLLDMSQNATMEHSGLAAQMVLDKLQGVGPVHQRRVQRAGFVVLKSPDIPSLLVEAAFISNPDEEARLTNPTQQQRLAEAVLRGIKAYFRKHPVPGAALADDDDEGKKTSGNKRVAGSG
ncbi:MAG TPA: N-acetylmuramoyl-L-alanine amidase [Chromatiaceae bacterium]|nr:N-acetylmuramoyl-L-alanine amidase [Chromatiaceae bacterium]